MPLLWRDADQTAHDARTPASRAAFVDDVLDDALRVACVPGGARVFGIAGLQGSGKSTLAAQLAARADARGSRLVIAVDRRLLPRSR